MYVLVEGMPGSGKTTLARRLASLLRLPYIKSVISDTEHGQAIRAVLSEGEERAMEMLYLCDLALDEIRVRDRLAAGGLVRDKTYASSLAHVRAHGFVSENPAVRVAIEACFAALARESARPDLVVFLKSSYDVVRSRMETKTDTSCWDLRLTEDPEKYARQGAELETALSGAYGDRLLVVNSDREDVEAICKRVAKTLREGACDEP